MTEPICDNCFGTFPEPEWGVGWRIGHERYCSGECQREHENIRVPDHRLLNRGAVRPSARPVKEAKS